MMMMKCATGSCSIGVWFSVDVDDDGDEVAVRFVTRPMCCLGTNLAGCPRLQQSFHTCELAVFGDLCPGVSLTRSGVVCAVFFFIV